jgi:type I restriction-modification system DNA methylase subunit
LSTKSLVKTKKRIKEQGEVFTPQWLVDEMLDELPQDVFTNPEKTFIDPACGDGNFLVRVLERKIQNGSTPLQALQTTYGVDIMQDNIDDCRRRLIKVAMGLNSGKLEKSWREPLLNNIKCANTLEKPLEEIFSD